MELDGFPHALLDIGTRGPGRHTSREVRGVGGVPGLGLLDDDEERHGFSPACLRMLLRVPGARSSPGWPVTVTKPGLVGCVHCWWHPPGSGKVPPVIGQ